MYPHRASVSPPTFTPATIAPAATSAASAAAAAAASTVAEISLERLLAANPAHFTEADNASRAQAREYQIALSNDTFGLVLGYLPQTEQLAMRPIDASVRSVVDAQLRTLTVSCEEAITLLSQPNNIHQLRELRLSHWGDGQLSEIAALLTELPSPNLKLVLNARGSYQPSERDVRALGNIAATTLSSIELIDMSVSPALCQALSADGVCPVSIELVRFSDGVGNVYHMSQIPTLVSLDTTNHHISDASVAALSTHQLLTTLKVRGISANAVCDIVKSTSIRDLAIRDIRGNSATVFNALAQNHTLTSLSAAIGQAASLEALSRNSTLKTLRLSLWPVAASGLPMLANLPALESLTLDFSSQSGALRAADIGALCAKPLQSLSVQMIEMDQIARATIATARASNLSLSFCTPFDDEQIDMLKANPSLRSLEINAGVSDAAAPQLAHGWLPEMESLKLSFTSDSPEAAAEEFKSQWVQGGKQLANLQLSVDRYEEEEPAYSLAN